MRNKKLLLMGIVIMTIFFISSNTSDINLQWIKCYGGYLEENPVGMIKMTNGDVIIGSNSRSFDGDVGKIYGKKYEDQNIFIYRIDKVGKIVWKKVIGGSKEDSIDNIIQMEEGKFIISGYTYSNDYDMKGSGVVNKDDSISFIFIFDKNGKIINKIFLSCFNQYDYFEIRNFNNGFIINLGSAMFNNAIPKFGYYLLSNDLKLIWDKNILKGDRIFSDGSFIYVINKVGNKIEQYDKDGNLIKTSLIKQGNFSFPYFYHIKLVNNYFIFSYQNQIKIVDLDGNIVLEKKIEPKSPYNENYFSDFISYSKDKFILVSNNYVIIDKDKQDEFQTDICIMLMDQKGNILEEKYIKGNWVDSTKYLYPLSDHEFILLGQTNSTGGDIQGAHVDYNISELGNDKDILVVKFSIE